MKLPAIPEPLRAPARWVGYPLFALLVFFLSLYWTLPRARIRERIETLASANLNADVTMNDFGLRLLFGAGVEASGVSIRTRPALPSEKPVRYVIDDVVVRFGLVDAARGRTDVSFKAHLADGEARGALRASADEGFYKVDAAGIKLGAIPGLQQVIGLPIDGKLEAHGQVTLPKNLVPRAKGEVEVIGDAIVVGDGKAKLVLQGNPMLEQGVTVPRLQLGKVSGSVTADKGRATFKDVHAKSGDIEVYLDGYVELREPIQMSAAHLYLRIKMSDALVKREPTMELMSSMLGPAARRPDGYLGISLVGVLSSLVPTPAREAPIGVTLGKAPAVTGGAVSTVGGGTSRRPPPRGMDRPPEPSRVMAPGEMIAPSPSEPPSAQPEPMAMPSEENGVTPPPPPSTGMVPPMQMAAPTAIPPPARFGTRPFQPSPTEPASAAETPPAEEGRDPPGAEPAGSPSSPRIE